MSESESILLLVKRLTEEVQRLSMAQTVQRSAFVVLVRHLAALGLAQPDTLATDLLTMADAQPEAGWKSGHAEIAAALKLLRALPSKNLKSGARQHK